MNGIQPPSLAPANAFDLQYCAAGMYIDTNSSVLATLRACTLTHTHVMGQRFCVSRALSAGCSPPGGRNVGSIAVRHQVQTETRSGVTNYLSPTNCRHLSPTNCRHRLPSSRIRLRFGHRDRSKRRWHTARHKQGNNSQRIGAAVERIVFRTRERDAQAPVASNERSPGPACIGSPRGEGGGGGGGNYPLITPPVSLIKLF
jgi:hypothetical protein